MSHPFDATLKELVRRYPLDWFVGLGLETEQPVRALDVDLSTVSAEADKVLGIGDPLSSVVQLNFKAAVTRRFRVGSWCIMACCTHDLKFRCIAPSFFFGDRRTTRQ